MDSLFDEPRPSGAPAHSQPPPDAPLAARLRPATLQDVVGQEHLLHEGAPLRAAIDAGRPHSMILHGPPGTGKTTLARIVATSANAAFEELSAVNAGKAEVAKVLERARHRRETSNTPTVFFLDEIHRFNKAQQDALLPAVEEGVVVLIGATTENPSFSVNNALLSRAQVYRLNALDADQVHELLARATAHLHVEADDDALALLAQRSDGDARSALGALELAAAHHERVTTAVAEEALQRRVVRFDRAGDHHYDTISAWIKATRASDPDASLYYLAVMLEGGEDARFIARRMVIFASEDIGNAKPQALMVAVATAQAVEHVGLPEAVHALAQCAVYLALAPKSNAAYRAIAAAREHVRTHGVHAPPPGLTGDGSYDYPHDHPGHVSATSVLPPGLEGVRFFEPDAQEPAMVEALAAIRAARGLT